MTLRELLQIELWSKGTRKMLVVFGCAIGIVLVALVSWRVVDRLWITRGERNAAKSALVQLDALQDSGVLSDMDFAARAKQAEGSVNVAEQAARTTRDRFIVAELMNYQAVVLERQVQSRRQIIAQQREFFLTHPNWKTNGPAQSFGVATIGFDSRELHKELD